VRTIQEYFAELVAAGLAPDWSNITAYYSDKQSINIWNDDRDQCITVSMGFKKFDKIQLRKDGIDLVKLEWKNPGGQDIGRMCWYYDECGTIVLLEFHQDEFEYAVDMCKFKRYLLATHGRLCPAVDNFLEVYNEK